MKAFQRILAVLLCLVMSLGMISMVASAEETANTAFDKTRKDGVITIHKYEYNKEASAPDLPYGDGTSDGSETVPPTAKPLEGVTFELYLIKDANDTEAYYSGSTNTVLSWDQFVDANGTPKQGVTLGNPVKTQTTSADGTTSFTGLSVGIYLVIEKSAPASVTKKADPFLVSIPMTNPDNEREWMYAVDVYPKNSTSEQDITIEKYSNAIGTRMSAEDAARVKFSLKKLTGENAGKYVQQNIDEDQKVSYTFSEELVKLSLTDNKLNLTKLPYGEYELKEVETAPEYILDNRPVKFTISETGAFSYTEDQEVATANGANYTINIINEKPTIDKVINDATTEDPSGKNTAGVGDVIDVTVTVDVPLNIKEMKNFVVTDTPTGMKVNEGSVTVSCNGTADGHTAIAASEYSVDYTQPTGGFTFKFNNNATCAHGGEKLTITYKATITSDAITSVANDVDTASNTVTLKYDSTLGTAANPHTTTDDDDTKLYKATITKTLNGANYADVEGTVKFKLYKNAACTELVNVVHVSDGVYKVADNDGDTLVKDGEMTVSNSGTLVIDGLAQHDYYLVETQTKEGYNLLSGAVKLEVKQETGEPANDFSVSLEVVNKKGFTLPQTGGIGTLMFIIIGGVLMAGGICLIVPNKKRAI